MIIQVVNVACLFLSTLFLVAHSPGDEDKPLFNGTDLSGWINVIGASESWTAARNSISATGIPKGVLRTDRQYENYILEFEYKKPMSHGRAGILIHSDALPAKGSPWPRGINIQFWDSGNGLIEAVGGAGIRTVKNPQLQKADGDSSGGGPPAAGERWHHVRVKSSNGAVTLRVDGKPAAMGLYASLRKGYIALKSDGSQIQFRNIRLRELPAADLASEQVATKDRGFVSLYNGRDVGRHWELLPGHRGHWTGEDWLINYDGGSEEERKSLWSKGKYADFILTADMKFTGRPEMAESPVVLPNGENLKTEDGSNKTVVVPYAGDTGIYVRGSSKNQVNMGNRFIGSGEIYGYRADRDMPREVRQALIPRVNADAPPGEWNRYRITMKGDRITVVLNGTVVIDDARLPGIAPTGKIALQDDHGRGNRFVFGNLYIKELE
ncbi:protein of unknown function [Fodinibius roseus]|uniref:3-keto-alpha-glucoside-1,2-lyase/3-keto-2-hydroxy-glucal hydratase domain-containing protein n=1 Tax=Fodinibius roseus TaxID=1194090 RepID=A0A1M4XJS9_9BACT|nr:DUF1080 domain-containing protein [Fodinibius roseus]SHE93755.1 protein of unknown function [Fodinibius roseus]